MAILSSASSPSPVHSEATWPVPAGVNCFCGYTCCARELRKAASTKCALLLRLRDHNFSNDGEMRLAVPATNCASGSKRRFHGSTDLASLLCRTAVPTDPFCQYGTQPKHLMSGQAEHDEIRIGTIQAVPAITDRSSVFPRLQNSLPMTVPTCRTSCWGHSLAALAAVEHTA